MGRRAQTLSHITTLLVRWFARSLSFTLLVRLPLGRVSYLKQGCCWVLWNEYNAIGCQYALFELADEVRASFPPSSKLRSTCTHELLGALLFLVALFMAMYSRNGG